MRFLITNVKIHKRPGIPCVPKLPILTVSSDLCYFQPTQLAHPVHVASALWRFAERLTCEISFNRPAGPQIGPSHLDDSCVKCEIGDALGFFGVFPLYSRP